MKHLAKTLSLYSLSLALLLGGCIPNPPQAPVVPQLPPPPVVASYRDTLTWAQNADVVSFDPHLSKESSSIQVLGQIYDTLLTVNEEMQIQPMLAKEWRQIDPLTYEFLLRDDVYFHDGSKFTAADAKFSLERAKSFNQVAFVVDMIDSVTVINDYTLQLSTKEPYAPTLLNLSHPAVSMLSKAYCQEQPEILKNKPMGTGPFAFSMRVPDQFVRLAANERYWGGAPKTKFLEMQVITNSSFRAEALQKGAVDIAYDILPHDISTIRENPALVMLEVPALTTFTLGMNHTRENLSDPLLREAIRVAINPQELVDFIFFGAGEMADTMIPLQAFGFQKDAAKIEYNTERAKALLVEAGKPDGFTLQLVVNKNETRIQMCQVIQAQLQRVGIVAEIEVLEFADFIQKISTPDFDACLMGWTTSTGDADYTYFPQFHSKSFGLPGNRVNVALPGMDALLEQARSSADPSLRMELYRQVEEILTQHSVNRPLLSITMNAGLRNTVEGFTLMPNGYHRFHQVAVHNPPPAPVS